MIELCDHDDNLMDHVKEFLENSLDFGIQKDEDTYMKSFLLHLQEESLTWYQGLGKGII